MGTGSRIQREIEEIDDVLRRIIASIDYGNADVQEIRRCLERLRREQLHEADRLARKIKHELAD